MNTWAFTLSKLGAIEGLEQVHTQFTMKTPALRCRLGDPGPAPGFSGYMSVVAPTRQGCFARVAWSAVNKATVQYRLGRQSVPLVVGWHPLSRICLGLSMGPGQ